MMLTRAIFYEGDAARSITASQPLVLSRRIRLSCNPLLESDRGMSVSYYVGRSELLSDPLALTQALD
jgi:hypothetical protein